MTKLIIKALFLIIININKNEYDNKEMLFFEDSHK